MIFSPNVAWFLIGQNVINEVLIKRSILVHFAALGSKKDNIHGSIWIQNDQELKALSLAEVGTGILLYTSHIGMCCPKGFGFCAIAV